MLTELLRALEQNGGRVNLTTLGRQLNADPRAVAGMIETLLAKGRLQAIVPGCTICETCSLNATCNQQSLRARRLRVVRREPLVSPE